MIRLILRIGEIYFAVWGILRLIEIIAKNCNIDIELTDKWEDYIENFVKYIKEDYLKMLKK